MIRLSLPHVALNDPRAPVVVHMQRSFMLGATEQRQSIIDRVVNAAAQLPSGVIRNVVLNAHGNADYIQLGQGFTSAHADLFQAWQGKVRKVWLRACLVARRGASGHSLPAEIARAAHCHVVASTELQADYGDRRLPYGQLDSFEGLVISFGPNGRASWSHRYRSTYPIDNDGNYWRNPD